MNHILASDWEHDGDKYYNNSTLTAKRAEAIKETWWKWRYYTCQIIRGFHFIEWRKKKDVCDNDEKYQQLALPIHLYETHQELK